MQKRIAAGALCLFLVFQLSAPPARAAGGYVCFMAAGDSILPLSDQTMPFWQGGYLYISSSIFTDTVRTALGISRVINDSGQLILYNGSQTLWFNPGRDHSYDQNGKTYLGCQVRNGEIYVPAATVAQFFGLQYSVTDVSLRSGGQQVKGNLVWLRQPGSVMTDQEFFAAATFAMVNRYEDYLQAKQSQAPSEPDDTSSGTEIEGRKVYLCLMGDDQAASLLDALDRCHAQAAFFCTPEFLSQQGDLLRRMSATGHSVGILADAKDAHRSVEDQLKAGNQSLESATCGKTRLALIQNGGERELQKAREMGFRCLEAQLDRSGYRLHSSSAAAALLQRISSRRGNVTVWLGDRASAAGLREFLSAAEDAEGRCLAWTETA